MKCEKCGAEVAAGSLFCTKCGAPMPPAGAPAQKKTLFWSPGQENPLAALDQAKTGAAASSAAPAPMAAPAPAPAPMAAPAPAPMAAPA
ncbi:MAG: zinc-ribbon domain-containing protein, partial [Deltaproteobacteria bacterium]|nr:zinc-ribbon domain-containing protein [Deltaproteobacteria bacterium]